MLKWFTRHAAFRWAILLLMAATSSGQTVDEAVQVSTEESFVTDITTGYPETTTRYPEITTAYTEITTAYTETTSGQPEITTEYPEITNVSISETSLRDATSSDTQRSERMVAVYVKPDPKAKTGNISDFLDYGDIIVETRDKETIVVTNPDEDEYEESADGDVMSMAARSLRQNLTEDQLAAEAASFESVKQSLLKDNDLKDVLYKWNREFNFNVTDLYKINLASVFAKEYDEMNKLMNENLVEDTDVFARSKGMAEGFEPRDFEAEKADPDMAVEATEVMSQQVLPPPSSTPPPVSTPRVRPNSQQRFQYAYQGRIPPMLQPVPGQQMFQRSDTGSPYLLLPRTASGARRPEAKNRPGVYRTVTGQPMTIHSDGPSMRSPAPLRQPSALAAPRIRRPESSPAPPGGRFGDRLANRLPRPFQRILNMTMGSRQTTTESPKTFISSSIAHLPAPSVSHPARVRAPYHLQQSYRNSIPPNVRNRPPVAATTTRPLVTTEASRTNYGARIRPSRIERQRNSTNGMQKVKEETKEQRDMKISQLRSNLVGKLVVIQSMLDEKQKRSKPVNGRAPTAPYKRLPGGLLKPIVPLRPRINAATTVSPVTTTDNEEEVVTTETTTIVWKDKKKYRRPPSFRKENPKISSEKVREVTTAQGEVVEGTTTGGISNATEPPAYDELNSTRPADVDETASTVTPIDTTADVIAPSVEKVSSTVNSTETTQRSSSTPASNVTALSVETSFTKTAAESATETKLEKNRSTSAPDAMASPVQAVPTKSTATTAGSSTEATDSNETSTPTSASSVESTSSTKQPSLNISTEARIDGQDALSTPRPVAAPHTVPTPVEIGATGELPTGRQETTTVPNIEDSSSVANATETLSKVINSTSNSDLKVTAPQSVGTVPETTSVSPLQNTTENGNTSTYAPEDDPYLKAMIERALQLSEKDKPEDIQGNFPEEDDPLEPLEEVPRGYFRDLIRETEEDYPKEDDIAFPEGVLDADFGGSTKENLSKNGDILSNPRHESDEIEDGSFDLPDDALDPVGNEDEGLSNIDSLLLRVDRSAEVNTMMHRKPAAAIELARGGVRPVNLPYNILPDNLDKLNEAQPTGDGRNDASEMQARESEVAIPLSSYPIFQVQRNPPLAGFINKFYSRFRS